MSAARRELRLLLLGRGLRAGVDGCLAVLLPAYLLALGHGVWEVGVLSTATLLGSALATLALGAWGHRAPQRSLLLGAALLMAATGLGFAGLTGFWPLLLVAFFGTLNPGSGDVSVFLPLEHARLAQVGEGMDRTQDLRPLQPGRGPVRCGRRLGRRPAGPAGRCRRRSA
jgi:MFS family permease